MWGSIGYLAKKYIYIYIYIHMYVWVYVYTHKIQVLGFTFLGFGGLKFIVLGLGLRVGG